VAGKQVGSRAVERLRADRVRSQTGQDRADRKAAHVA
jgi:hypothetical protein